MNQYERIVSYIYQYQGEEKGSNVGYAKVEKRGNKCRISVQMRAVSVREVPKVYFYKQLSDRIQTIPAGQMMFRGNSFLWKDSCDADKLFGSDWSVEDVDGIFVDGADVIYFATTWKKDYFKRGDWNGNAAVDEMTKPAAEMVGNVSETERDVRIGEELSKEQPEIEAVSDNMEAAKREQNETADSSEAESISQKLPKPDDISSKDASLDGTMQEDALQQGDVLQPGNAEISDAEKRDLQMQSICGVCPFKRKSFDYGKKILMTFPSMKPFENGVAKACVRMELQDIGCLPIASWSLSGNRFLLHGYYCYRHLLFAQLINGKYVLGVPGIYSEKERRNAVKFGFSDFQSIGDFGMQQGVFGYWFLELPEGHLS